MTSATPDTEPRHQNGVSASHLLARCSLFAAVGLVFLLIYAATVRIPGVYWLLGYGPESDFSFHPDDQRFIVSAKDFANPSAKPSGYPLFMVTQLVVINSVLKKLSHVQFNRAVILRSISLAWGLAGILFIYIFAVNLGLSSFVGLMASFFLAVAPYHIITSHFGTADMTVLVLFYLTIFAAWRYRVSSREPWLYAAIAVSGMAMADKFFLPALVAPTMIVVFQPSRLDYSKLFLAICVFVAFFCGASFFNFTPWDFRNLFEMLLYDNLIVEGGKSPLRQIVLYSWEIVPGSGVLASAFAFIGGLVLCRRAGAASIARILAVLSNRKNNVVSLYHRFVGWLYTPSSIIIVPLAIHMVLIITANVHFPRHVLIFVPVVCVFAAIGVQAMVRRLRSAPVLGRSVGVVTILALLVVQLINGVLTDKIYTADIRINLAEFLNMNGLTTEAETLDSYTYLRGVSSTEEAPTATVFIACDIEYERYLLASRGLPAYHLTGGKARTDFYASLFNGTAGYVPIHNVRRERRSLEDHLGWLPMFATYVPNECYAFKRYTG